MLDLVFAVLMVIIIVKANKGEVNDTLCSVAFVVGLLAGLLGLIQTFFLEESVFWPLNVFVLLFACVLKRIAKHFARLYNQKKEEIEEEYRKARETHSRDSDKTVYTDENFDDPNIRFGGGDGSTWNGK